MVRAGVVELGAFREQWEAVREELEAAGHDFEFEERVETRGLPSMELPEPETIVIVLYVAKKLAGETVDSVARDVVAAAKKHLRGRLKRQPRRVVVIHDPNSSEPFARVEVPEED